MFKFACFFVAGICKKLWSKRRSRYFLRLWGGFYGCFTDGDVPVQLQRAPTAIPAVRSLLLLHICVLLDCHFPQKAAVTSLGELRRGRSQSDVRAWIDAYLRRGRRGRELTSARARARVRVTFSREVPARVVSVHTCQDERGRELWTTVNYRWKNWTVIPHKTQSADALAPLVPPVTLPKGL